MAEADSIAQDPVPTKEQIQSAGGRIADLYLTLEAMHDLCHEQICGGLSSDDPETAMKFVLLRALLRGAARDAETCAWILSGDRESPGFFEGHFGSI
ncbi:hypothetical protein UB44_23295 [Burkholderiaceae bacterium 26]|nr:hypothetical protein UB44_23295 [Burkholderiaceae bacterium 26]